MHIYLNTVQPTYAIRDGRSQVYGQETQYFSGNYLAQFPMII